METLNDDYDYYTVQDTSPFDREKTWTKEQIDNLKPIKVLEIVFKDIVDLLMIKTNPDGEELERIGQYLVEEVQQKLEPLEEKVELAAGALVNTFTDKTDVP